MWADTHDWTTNHGRARAMVALSFLASLGATLLCGNGFIAAFAAEL